MENEILKQQEFTIKISRPDEINLEKKIEEKELKNEE